VVHPVGQAHRAARAILFALLWFVGVAVAALLAKVNDETPTVFSAETESLPGGEATPIAQSERQKVREEGSGANYPQGAFGRVVGPGGNPLPNIEVYLMAGAELTAVAHTRTDENGTFELGVTRPASWKRYEIRVASDRYTDKRVPDVHIAEAKWYDSGIIRLDRALAPPSR